MSADRSAELDDLCAALHAERRHSGAALLAKGGAPVFERCRGARDLRGEKPIGRRSALNLASAIHRNLERETPLVVLDNSTNADAATEIAAAGFARLRALQRRRRAESVTPS